MMLRLAALGAIGYAAYKYYDKNREAIDGPFRAPRPDQDLVGPAGGPISGNASVVHAGESPVD